MKASIDISAYLVITSVLLYGAVQSSPVAYAFASSSTNLDSSPASEYLQELFKSVEDSGREPNSSGEMNLLKDESQGFANMVQALPVSITSQNNNPNSRLLSFNLNRNNIISKTQHVVCFRLVVSTPPKQPLFKVNVYTGTNSATPVDSGTSGDKWIDLSIDILSYKVPLEQRDNFQVVLEVVQLKDVIDANAILNAMTPMLVMYSYDSHLLETLFQVDRQSNNVNKRSIPDHNTDTESFLDAKKKQFCQLHSVELNSYHDLGLHPELTVIDPSSPSFNYCYGHCKAVTVEEKKMLTPHSQLVGFMDPILAEEGIIPCCIPKERASKKFETKSISNPGMVMLFTVETVLECGCF